MWGNSVMIYKVGFWILTAVVAGCMITGALILNSYDKHPLDILFQVLGTSDDVRDIHHHYAWLPNHYTDNLEPSSYSYAENVETLEDFYDWKYTPGGVLAIYDDRPTVNDVTYDGAEVVETHDRNKYTLSKITMPSFFDPEVVIFYELLPNTDAPYDAVLVIPGSGHSGALDVLGESGPWQEYYYHDGIAKTLVEADYAVYVIELRGYGERAIDVGMACNNKGHPPTCSSFAVEDKMTVFGISMGDIRTDEITQVLAYVESRSYTRDVSVAGLSLGADLTVNQAIINGDVVDAVVMASGMQSVIHAPLNMESNNSEMMISCCDTVDRLATIPPMPAYVSFGMQETTAFRWEAESGYTGNFLAEVYQLHNAPDNFHYVAHDGPHGYHVESVLAFLDMHLGK